MKSELAGLITSRKNTTPPRLSLAGEESLLSNQHKIFRTDSVQARLDLVHGRHSSHK